MIRVKFGVNLVKRKKNRCQRAWKRGLMCAGAARSLTLTDKDIFCCIREPTARPFEWIPSAYGPKRAAARARAPPAAAPGGFPYDTCRHKE